MSDVVIEAIGIRKEFGHIHALRGASLQVHRGEVVALVGDNGAGKSTLLKTMCGAIEPSAGELRVLDQPVEFASVRDAHSHGIDTVFQDLALAGDLSVADSIFLGHEEVTGGPLGRLGKLARRQMAAEAEEALAVLGIKLASTGVRIRDLSGGQRQAVAIARAVKWATNVIMLDEPTAALGVRQTEIVCSTVRAVAAGGLGVLMISHDMPRMIEIADRIVVLRHGAVAADVRAADATIPAIVGAMLGAEESARVTQ